MFFLIEIFVDTPMFTYFYLIGFRHEHQRQDRCRWVNVQSYTYPLPEGASNSVKVICGIDVDTPYDYCSFMHNSAWDLSKVQEYKNIGLMGLLAKCFTKMPNPVQWIFKH